MFFVFSLSSFNPFQDAFGITTKYYVDSYEIANFSIFFLPIKTNFKWFKITKYFFAVATKTRHAYTLSSNFTKYIAFVHQKTCPKIFVAKLFN